jgi:hypothetical protein
LKVEHELDRISFPAVPDDTTLPELELSVRTYNCLVGLVETGILRKLSDIANFTPESLLNVTRGFGAKSLVDLCVSLEMRAKGYVGTNSSLPPRNARPLPENMASKPEIPKKPEQPGGNPDLTLAEIWSLIQRPSLLSRFLDHRFPRISPAARIGDFRLSVRTRKAVARLCRGSGSENLCVLSSFSLRSLLRTKNFGRTSLLELLVATAPVVLDVAATASACGQTPIHAQLSPDLTRVAKRLSCEKYAAKLRSNDPRLGKYIHSLLFLTNGVLDDDPLGPSATLYLIAHRLANRGRDPVDATGVSNAIASVRRKIRESLGLTLQEELKQLLECFASPRNRQVLLKLYGWAGEPPQTLQVTGEAFKLTRERVRQIAAKFENSVSASKPFMPVLDETLRHILRLVPSTYDCIERALTERGLINGHFSLSSLLSASRILGRTAPFAMETSRGLAVVIASDSSGTAAAVFRAASGAISHYGIATIDDVIERVEADCGTRLPRDLACTVLGRQPGFFWLDRSAGWFWMREVPRNHLRTIVRKILALAPRIAVSELRDGVARDCRGLGFAPPKRVLIEFCRRACDCVCEGESIIVADVPEVQHALSDAERLIVSVLRQHGPVLYRTELERLCIENGINQSTINIYMGRSPILARYAVGVYGLIGSKVSPFEVEACLPRGERGRRISDQGWTEDGKPWTLFQLSAAVISSGVFSVPAAISQFVRGRFVLRVDESSTATIVVNAGSSWGLGPWLRRRGGELGDYVLMKFDLRLGEVTVDLGPQSDLLETVSQPAFRPNNSSPLS